MREFINMVFSVDFNNQRFVIPTFLFDTNGQDVFAVFVYANIIEFGYSFGFIESRDIISSVELIFGHKLGKSLEFCFLAVDDDTFFLADFYYLQSVYKWSVAAVLLIVAKVVFKIFDTPSCKVQRVFFFVVQ